MKRFLSIYFLFLIGFGQVGIHYAHNHGEGVRHEHQTIHAPEDFCSVCAYSLQLSAYQPAEIVFIQTPAFAEVQYVFNASSPFINSSLRLEGRAPPAA